MYVRNNAEHRMFTEKELEAPFGGYDSEKWPKFVPDSKNSILCYSVPKTEDAWVRIMG